MGKPSVAGVALIRTAPLASFNAFAALKIDLAFMILGESNHPARLYSNR